MTLDRTQAPASSRVTELNLPEPTVFKTSNGAQILVVEDDSAEIVYLEIILESGRWMENPFGVGYYASKLLSEGTSRFSSSELAEAFEIQGSYLQISPGLDHINIRLYALKKTFRDSLALLQHIFEEATFPQSEFERMRAIRFQEIKNQHSRNNQFASAKFQEAIFGPDHPYGKISTVENLSGITRDDIVSYAQENLWTRPTIILVGKLDNEVELVTDWVDSKTLSKPNVEEQLLAPTKDPISIFRENSTQASVRLGGMAIDKRHPDFHNLSITNMMFGGFFGSRLMKNIREKKGLTYGIYSQLAHLKNASYLVISAEVEQQNSALVINEIQQELSELSNQPPSKEEVDTVLNYTRGKLLASIDSTLSLVSIFKSQLLFNLEKDHQSKFLQALDKFEPKTASDMASKYLTITNEVVVA